VAGLADFAADEDGLFAGSGSGSFGRPECFVKAEEENQEQRRCKGVSHIFLRFVFRRLA
jgi:hypothetical protein